MAYTSDITPTQKRLNDEAKERRRRLEGVGLRATAEVIELPVRMSSVPAARPLTPLRLVSSASISPSIRKVPSRFEQVRDDLARIVAAKYCVPVESLCSESGMSPIILRARNVFTYLVWHETRCKRERLAYLVNASREVVGSRRSNIEMLLLGTDQALVDELNDIRMQRANVR